MYDQVIREIIREDAEPTTTKNTDVMSNKSGLEDVACCLFSADWEQVSHHASYMTNQPITSNCFFTQKSSNVVENLRENPVLAIPHLYRVRYIPEAKTVGFYKISEPHFT